MSGTTIKINLPWHQYDQYWVAIYPKNGHFLTEALAALQYAGFGAIDGGMGIRTDRAWKPAWDAAYAVLQAQAGEVEAVVQPGADAPGAGADRKPLSAIAAIADSLWLGEAVLDGRLLCYLQPVVSGPDKVFGYESFARVKGADGTIIAGDQIFAASRALGIEYTIDRLLHIQAIRTFASSEFHGFLFVNFFSGFIQRPAVYLEGLSETAKSYGVVAKNIVLDLTQAETPRDIAHLKSVCEYGRSCGYSIALDDIVSLPSARKLVGEIHPDFVKIDMQLARRIDEPGTRETIREIVEMVHAGQGTVIGEGVETDATYQALRQLGVDLFQGYLFSPPVPVEAALKKSVG